MKANRWATMIKLKSYIIFLLGLVFAVIALSSDITLTKWDKVLAGVFNIGISIMAVSIVTFIWDFFGGDPVSSALQRLTRQSSLETTGLRGLRIRQSAVSDNGFTGLQARLKPGSEVDLMGLVLQREWFNKQAFLEKCGEVLGHGKKCRFRVILPMPFGAMDHPGFSFENSKNLYQRAYDELIGTEGARLDNPGGPNPVDQAAHRMNMEIGETLEKLCWLHEQLPSEIKSRLQVKVAIGPYMSCSVLRIDNYACIINYLHKKGGKSTPMLEVEGPGTELFRIYLEEFETVWKSSRRWDLAANNLAIGAES
jgi:hypothetical protein